MYKRVQYQTITKRLKEPRHFLQVVLGPRQVGKTTVIKQVVNDLNLPYQIYSADSIPANRHLGFQTVGIRQEYRCE